MKALIGVVMMCVAGGVAAEDSALVKCTRYAELAQTVMKARQAGVPGGRRRQRHRLARRPATAGGLCGRVFLIGDV